jgi:hypothetical protein
VSFIGISAVFACDRSWRIKSFIADPELNFAEMNLFSVRWKLVLKAMFEHALLISVRPSSRAGYTVA